MSRRSASKPSQATTVVPPSDVVRRLQAALGKDFELGESLGSGGFADVYVAWDRRLKREVAVKTIRPELAGTSGVLERFRREAEAIAQLRHPHIVQVYSVGEGDGIAYFTMPRIRGESLAAALHRDERWAFSEVVRILRESAGALAEAHRHGIVHRDVKPENIMLDGPERRVVVMDFGIAKSVDETAGALTGTGILVGTPHYMSPEQATGEKNIDHLSDQYSLGIVGYRLVTGRLPFDADSVRALLFQQAAGTITPVRELRPDIPVPLARVIERALQKEPSQRYRSMDEFAEALGSVASEVAGEFRTARRVPAMPERWASVQQETGGRERRHVVIAAVALVALVFAYRSAELGSVREVLGARDDISYEARTHLASHGAPAGTGYLMIASSNQDAVALLHRAVGRDSLEAIIRGGRIVTWRAIGNWSSAESWSSGVGLGRQLVTWMHWLPDSTARRDVSADSARTLAEGELREQAVALGDVRSLRRSENSRRSRIDRTFTWEQPALNHVAGVDTLFAELTVTVSGDEVSEFSRAFRIVSHATHGLSFQARSIATGIALLLMVGGAVGAGVLLMRRSARDTLQWGLGARLGIAAPALVFVSYTIPRIIRSLSSDQSAQRALFSALDTFVTDLPNFAMMGTFTTVAFVCAESFAYEKRPDLTLGVSEWARGRFAIPESIPAALAGYAGGLMILAGIYATLAVGRGVLGAPVEGTAFLTAPFQSPIPSLAVPFTAAIAIASTLPLCLFVAYALHRGRSVLASVATFGILGGMFLLGATGHTELRVVTEVLAITAAGWLLYRRGALAALIALHIIVGVPVTFDMLWAGGPFTGAGLAGVAFLLLPAAAAVAAYRRRPWATAETLISEG